MAWSNLLWHYFLFNDDNEALLVSGFVGFLVFVLLEAPVLAVVLVTRVVIVSLAHPLLILLGFRIVLGVLGLERSSEKSGGQNPVFKSQFHESHPWFG